MSSSRNVVVTSKAPAPPPFLSQAVILDNTVFCSGQVGCHPETGAMAAGTVADRSRQVLENLKAVLEASGSSLDNVAKVNIYLTKSEDFAAMNAVYESFFTKPMPARTCVFVKALPLGTDVEMECVARVAGTKSNL